MKRLIAILLSGTLLLSGCAQSGAVASAGETEAATVAQTDTATTIATVDDTLENAEEVVEDADSAEVAADDDLENLDLAADYDDSDVVKEYQSLSDPRLTQYIEDAVYAELVDQYQSEDYIIENVEAVYISEEYLEEFAYNSKANIFFGYTLAELDEQFDGTPYVFTLGEDGTTTVVPMGDYDDTYEQVIKNIAVGTGVILICVTVSVVSGGVGLAPVSAVFAAAAETGTTVALSTGAISGIFAGAMTGVETKDLDAALKAAALEGSKGFKCGAITGALTGGISEVSALRNASKAVDVAEDVQYVDEANILGEAAEDSAAGGAKAAEAAENTKIIVDETKSMWQQAEQRLAQIYGGDEQLTYLGGKVVPYGTKGATRPDLVRTVGDHLEAIECKYYNLANESCRNTMYRELEREVADRVANMPAGTTQRVVLDVTDRGFSAELVEEVVETIQLRLATIYTDIPVDIVGTVL